MPKSFLGQVSFYGFIHQSTNKASAIQGEQVTNTIFEYGIGASYHFMASPLAYNRMIAFATTTFGAGSVEDTVEFTSPTTTNQSQTYSGSSSFFSLGIGAKYYSRSGFGMRALLDYYRRSESYNFDSDVTNTKLVAGPRLLLGLAYRF
jgi:hypothetical protein